MKSPSTPSEEEERRGRLAAALGWAFDLTGTGMPPRSAGQRLVTALMAYPEDATLRALRRCAEEVKGRLCLADIIERITALDGRPSADEAWAQVGPATEEDTIITTEEALAAWAEVRHLGDETAARFAFRAAYQRIVGEHRAAGVPPRPHVSLGRDLARRKAVLARAVQAGRLAVPCRWLGEGRWEGGPEHRPPHDFGAACTCPAAYAEAISGIPAAVLLGKALPPRSAKVAEIVGAVATPGGPPRCGMTDCNGFTHGDTGAICPAWGPL